MHLAAFASVRFCPQIVTIKNRRNVPKFHTTWPVKSRVGVASDQKTMSAEVVVAEQSTTTHPTTVVRIRNTPNVPVCTPDIADQWRNQTETFQMTLS